MVSFLLDMIQDGRLALVSIAFNEKKSFLRNWKALEGVGEETIFFGFNILLFLTPNFVKNNL